VNDKHFFVGKHCGTLSITQQVLDTIDYVISSVVHIGKIKVGFWNTVVEFKYVWPAQSGVKFSVKEMERLHEVSAEKK
jgi:hypothetical protein